MRIVYIAQYFNLPNEAGGSRVYQFTKSWQARGHHVTVITSFFNPTKGARMPERYRGRLWARETVEGIDVIRVYSYPDIRGSIRRRLWNYLTFAVAATIVGWAKLGHAGLIYATSTPLTVGVPGLVLSVLKRAPLVFEVRDLWPQSAVVAGALEQGLLVRLLEAFARLLYRRSRRVVALTRGIQEGVRREVEDSGKVIFAPNGVDDWIAGELPSASREATGFEGRFVGIYVGAHGMWNGLETILDAAQRLRDDERFAFLFVGEGDDRARLVRLATERGLDNVRFLGARPKREAMELILLADYCLVVAWDHPFQRMVFPNKIFDYLGCGRPTLVAAAGEMADLVREAGAGYVVSPESPDELAGAVRRLEALPDDERRRMGERGRSLVLERYRRRDIADRLEAEFHRLAS